MKIKLIFLIILLSTKSLHSQDDKYFISFGSRPARISGTPGHAFVSWGKEDASSQLSSELTLGFFPKNKISALFDSPGKVKEGWLEQLKLDDNGKLDNKFLLWTIEIDKCMYDSTLSEAQKFNSYNYSLRKKVCTDLMHDVSKKMGLITPKSKNFLGFRRFPHPFNEELKKLNKTTKEKFCEKCKCTDLPDAEFFYCGEQSQCLDNEGGNNFCLDDMNVVCGRTYYKAVGNSWRLWKIDHLTKKCTIVEAWTSDNAGSKWAGAWATKFDPGQDIYKIENNVQDINFQCKDKDGNIVPCCNK